MFINIHRYKAIILGIMLTFVFISGYYFWEFRKNNTQEPAPPEQNEPIEYGEYLAWKEVSKLFPKYSKAKVIDFETGSAFYIQRRGGTYHADVQPLTAQDTAIMKGVYGGKWSWKRRAILLELENGRKIAASMHGMPHGQGNIPGNKFNGHFCIHFKDSITHGSRKVNLAHQMMIWKAAGIVEEQLQSLEQKQLIEAFLTALAQNDKYLAGCLLPPGESADELLEHIDMINNLKIDHIDADGDDHFNVTLRAIFTGSTREYKTKKSITLIPGEKHFLIDPSSLVNMFSQTTWVQSGEITDASLWDEY